MYHWEQEGLFAPAGKQLFFWGSGREMKDYLRQFLKEMQGMGLEPDEILLLSPYRETKNGLNYLLQEVFSGQVARPHLATLQGFCLEFLNREGHRIGLEDRPEVIRGWQEFLILKNLLPGLVPQGYDPTLWEENGLVGEILSFFNHLWGQGINPVEFRQRAHNFSGPQLLDLSIAYSKYADFCRQRGYLPLAAIAPLSFQLLQEHSFLLKKCREGRRLLIATDLDQLKPVQLQIVESLFAVFPYSLGLAFKGSGLSKKLKAGKSVQVIMGEELKREKKIQGYSNGEMENWGVAQKIGQLLAEGKYNPGEIAVFLGDTSRGQPLMKILAAMGIPCYTKFIGDTPLEPVLSFLSDYLEALMEPDNNEGQMKWLSSPLLGLDGLWLRRAFYRAQEQDRQLLDVLADTGKKPVKFFLHHLEGIRTACISPLEIVEELYEEYNLFQPHVDGPGEGKGQEVPEPLSKRQDFLLLARECEDLNHHFRGKDASLQEFLQQLEGAWPYLKREIRVAVGPGEGVMFALIRDAPKYMPGAAFLPAMAANIYPPQRIPAPLLGKGEWNELRDIFPHLELPPDFDPRRFHTEHRVALERGAAAADQAWISWARSYPEIEKTGPSDLLSENVEKRYKTEFKEEYHFTWPDPAPGATTRERLSDFYSQQISRGGAKPLPRAQEEPGQFGIYLKNLTPPIEGKRIAAQIDYFTPSAIRTYLACPRRYYYQNILKLKTPPYPRAQLGLFLHRVLEVFHRRFPSLFGVDEEIAGSYMEQVFKEIWLDMRSSFGKGLLSDFYRQEAKSICRAYLARELPNWEPGRWARVEETIDFTFRGNRLRGRWDRLDILPGGGWEIIDYKTGRDQTEGQRKREFLPREGEGPVDMQLIIYYLGARKKGISPEYFTWYRLSGLIGRSKVKRSLFFGEGKGGITPSDLEKAKGILTEILGEMRTNDYPPRPRNDRICKYCAFRFPCPGSQSLEEGEINE